MAEKTRSVLRDLGGSQFGAWVRDLDRKDCGLAGTQLHVVVVRRASLHSAFARSISLFISEICALQAYGHEAKGHDRHVECHEEPAAADRPRSPPCRGSWS